MCKRSSYRKPVYIWLTSVRARLSVTDIKHTRSLTTDCKFTPLHPSHHPSTNHPHHHPQQAADCVYGLRLTNFFIFRKATVNSQSQATFKASHRSFIHRFIIIVFWCNRFSLYLIKVVKYICCNTNKVHLYADKRICESTVFVWNSLLAMENSLFEDLFCHLKSLLLRHLKPLLNSRTDIVVMFLVHPEIFFDISYCV